MISGSDTVLITAQRPGPAITKFLDGWTARWVNMRVAITGADDSDFVDWLEVRASIPVDDGELLIVRDADMETAWEEHGYQIPGSAEGPLAILYQPCPARVFSVKAISDPYARDTQFKFEQYGVIVAGSGLTLMTVVTPDTDSKFFRDVIDSLIVSLA